MDIKILENIGGKEKKNNNLGSDQLDHLESLDKLKKNQST